jgi:hypothetical protein
MPREEKKDIDLEANDEDLSVYEDDDGEDSSEQGEKISGYKLIKQMEDSRHTTKNTRNVMPPDTFQVSQTDQSSQKPRDIESLNKSLAKSKSSE